MVNNILLLNIILIEVQLKTKMKVLQMLLVFILVLFVTESIGAFFVSFLLNIKAEFLLNIPNKNLF